ncbi:unnamed protein product [Heligmosomoides polygyrus]|uniref:LITAF domain-containing protein n=1 Tax=Heligmosomoides polygyrus TaxID=6339 RepID=A0A183GJS9_HELPZ|nr:unnamed protein product [Heligmosomoides polygyrus]
MPVDYTAVDVDPNTPPPYMDPTNSIAKKKSLIMHKKSVEHTGKRCEHCGLYAQPPGGLFIFSIIHPSLYRKTMSPEHGKRADTHSS